MEQSVNIMKPISSGSVVDQVLLQIRDAISSGRFRKGDRLPSEFELMKELGVSRNSLREAMKILEALGVIEIRRGDGTYICEDVKSTYIDTIAYSVLLEGSSAEELAEFRQTLDEDVLLLAVRKATEEDIKHLQELINQMRRYFLQGDLKSAGESDTAFHKYLAACTHNRFLERMVSGVYDLFAHSIEANIRKEENFASADNHHQAMLECIISRDESRVAKVVEESLSSWRKDTLTKMSI